MAAGTTSSGEVPVEEPLWRFPRSRRWFARTTHHLGGIGLLARDLLKAARLINDPSIFEALDDVVVGIDESKLLRWLIRNRQRSGIQKRYDKAQGASPEPAAPSTAP